MKKYLVIDAGGTFIKYAVMDEDARIIKSGKVPTPDYHEHTLDDFLASLDLFVWDHLSGIEGIAVSMPGMLNSDTGFCTSAGYLMYCSGRNMREVLKERYQVPVTIENDGKCAALAEHWKGSLKGVENGAVIVIGTGVAGGLILNGELYRGTHDTAGEFSFMSTNAENAMMEDTFWGFSNGKAGLNRRVSRETGWDEKSLTGEVIFQEANKGNKNVLKAIDDFTKVLAIQIYNLTLLLDLERVAIGGGVSRQPLLHQYLKKNYEGFVTGNPMSSMTPKMPRTELTNCQFFGDANLIGALYHFRKKEEKIA